MNVLVVLSYPFSIDHLAGGAQSMMLGQILALRNLGFRFRILSSKNSAPVSSEKGIDVIPELEEFSVMYPEPAAYARNISSFMHYVQGVDLVWTLDRAFPIVVQQPILMSYSTLGIYADESIPLFDTNWDAMLVCSEFSLQRVRELLPHMSRMVRPPRLEVVSPGIDSVFWQEGDSNWLARFLGHSEPRKYILFPHRPEAGKGHMLALKVMAELTEQEPDYHLLIPEPPVGSKFDAPTERAFIRSVRERAVELGLADCVTFHSWIDRGDRGHYYAGGSVCLYLSELPETFGLSAVEAATAGLPVVSLGAGALRESLPLGPAHLVIKEGSASAIARGILGIRTETTHHEDLRRWLFERHGLPYVAARLSEIMSSLQKADRRCVSSGAH